MKELLTAHEKLYDLPRDIVGVLVSTASSILGGASEVVGCQLAKAMVKVEFWDHQEALLNSRIFHLFPLIVCSRARGLNDLLPLPLPQK